MVDYASALQVPGLVPSSAQRDNPPHTAKAAYTEAESFGKIR